MRNGDPADTHVISLRLNRAEEMFVLAQTDLFSEYRNYLTGVEYSISMLRSSPARGPVRLDLALPASQIDDGVCDRIGRSLQRYCDHRIAYNRRERQALRLGGLSSLRIGVPIIVIGFFFVILAERILGHGGSSNIVLDTWGWVLVWVGLWFPLDTLLFSPLAFGRENRALHRLREAEISVSPFRPTSVA